MPAYNAAESVESAVTSVLAQDLQNFELLVCDDASRDGTWKVLQKCAHPMVRLFRNRKNQGAAGTRNRLLRLARGRYITPCDADDLMFPRNLSVLSRVLDENLEVGAVYADVLVLEMDRWRRLTRPPYFLGQEFKFGRDIYENVVNHGGSMIRKALMLRVGGYEEGVFPAEDWGLWLKLAEITKFKYLKGHSLYLWRRRHQWRRKPWGLTKAQKDLRESCRRVVQKAVLRRFGVHFDL